MKPSFLESRHLGCDWCVFLMNWSGMAICFCCLFHERETTFWPFFDSHCPEVCFYFTLECLQWFLRLFKEMLILKGQMAYYWSWRWKPYIGILNTLLLTSNVACFLTCEIEFIIISKFFLSHSSKKFNLRSFQYLKCYANIEHLLVFCKEVIYLKVKQFIRKKSKCKQTSNK